MDNHRGSVAQRTEAGRAVLVSLITSALTTTALFFGLRALFPAGAAGPDPAGAAEAAAPATAQVPALIGLRPDEARATINALGLVLILGDERDDPKVPAGAIADQTPAAGASAAAGSEVRVVLSRGARLSQVPDVTGKTAEQAVPLIEAAGLVGGRRVTEEADAPAGTVLRTSPPAGAEVAAGTAVDLVLAAGPSGVQVPRLVGLHVGVAKRKLAEAGLRAGRTRYTYDENFRGDVVLRQAVKPGEIVAPDTAVDLVLNEPD